MHFAGLDLAHLSPAQGEEINMTTLLHLQIKCQHWSVIKTDNDYRLISEDVFDNVSKPATLDIFPNYKDAALMFNHIARIANDRLFADLMLPSLETACRA